MTILIIQKNMYDAKKKSGRLTAKTQFGVSLSTAIIFLFCLLLLSKIIWLMNERFLVLGI